MYSTTKRSKDLGTFANALNRSQAGSTKTEAIHTVARTGKNRLIVSIYPKDQISVVKKGLNSTPGRRLDLPGFFWTCKQVSLVVFSQPPGCT